MYDIFLSYSSQDRKRVELLFRALTQQGWTVFWDHRSIGIGESWRDIIDEEIRRSKCVIVVWSRLSVDSRWVREEASIAEDIGILLPIKIDDIRPPLGFNGYQTGNFVHWNGEVSHPEFVKLANGVKSRLSGSISSLPSCNSTIGTKYERAGQSIGKKRFLWFATLFVMILMAFGIYWVLAREPIPIGTPPIIQRHEGQVDMVSQRNGVKDISPDMVFIPGGDIEFGKKSEKEIEEIEELLKKDAGFKGNYIDTSKKDNVKPFYISKYEVTVGQFRQFVSESPQQLDQENCRKWGEDHKIDESDKGLSWDKPGFEQGENHPVVCVSWNNANNYAKWLSQKHGKTYRLPTEVEWEFAARAGSDARYFWGNDDDKVCQYANMCDQDSNVSNETHCTSIKCPCSQPVDKYKYTAPVGSLNANKDGLYDIYGNVAEWTSTAEDGSPVESCKPKNEKVCNPVFRGGSWGHELFAISSIARRSTYTPDGAGYAIGFRLVQEVDENNNSQH